MHYVFVYGTLKRGFYNHKKYMQIAETKGTVIYITSACTCSSYPMILSPIRNVPVVLWQAGTGDNIHGEIYCIPDTALQALDGLEGIAIGFYKRKLIEISNFHEKCWIYVQDDKTVANHLNDMSMYKEYTGDACTL